jgi:hypothetical protein
MSETTVEQAVLTPAKLAAISRAMMRGTQPFYRYSVDDIVACADKHRATIDQAFDLVGKIQAPVIAAVAKAIMWFGVESVQGFCQRLREVSFKEEGDPAKVLYLFMMNRSKSSNERKDGQMYKKAVSALRYEVANRPCFKLHDAKEDFFPWVGGWSVPTKEE